MFNKRHERAYIAFRIAGTLHYRFLDDSISGRLSESLRRDLGDRLWIKEHSLLHVAIVTELEPK